MTGIELENPLCFFNLDKPFVEHAGNELREEAGKDAIVYDVSVRIDPALKESDAYSMMYRVTNLLYSWRYAVYAVAFAVFLLTVIAFIFLMYAAGRHPRKEEPSPGVLAGIPFDLLSVVMGGICLFLAVFIGFAIRGRFPDLIICAAATEAAILLFASGDRRTSGQDGTGSVRNNRVDAKGNNFRLC